MSIDIHTYKAFTNELEKIALSAGSLLRPLSKVGPIARSIGGAMHAGWNDGVSAGTRGWMGTGKYRHLPVGPKSLTVAGTGMMMPGAVAKEDPTGEGRSRPERLLRVAGNTAGGLVGMGLMGRTGFGKAHSILGPAIGGIGGAAVGEGIVGAPMAALRKRRLAQQLQRAQTTPQREVPDESWRAQSPAQSPPAREGQASLL